MLHDGIHEGIVSETDWELAHQKREKQVLNMKRHIVLIMNISYLEY